MSVGVWIKAARLRTLPLAIAGAITGNLMARAETGKIEVSIFILSVLTAILLQILSNYANDYGDFKNGADTDERTDRVMASGMISEKKMRTAIFLLVIITFFSGILLLVLSFGSFDLRFFCMLLLGIGGILAAYFYTAGKNPYGYIGLGDVAVLVFFGFVAVGGTYFLQTGTIHSYIWWIASAIGLLSTGVLNVNNIRDIVTDKLKNKNTIPTMLGFRRAILYHSILLIAALGCFAIYVCFTFKHPLQLVYLILLPLFIKHFYNVKNAEKTDRIAYNKQLKSLSLLTLITSLVFSFCQIFIQ